MNSSNDQTYYDSDFKKNRLSREIRELVQYRDLIWQMTIRNITVRYKRSLLGVMWALLDPLLTMVVMALVFNALFRRQIEHFPVFLLTGLMVWTFFSQSTNSAMRDFVSSERLISRVYLPQSIFVIIAISTGLVSFLIDFIALLAIAIVTHAPISLYTLTVILPLFILCIFNLGIGLILAPLGAYFTDMNNIYNIFLRLLMYLSAIFYQVEILPDWLQNIININPIYHFILMFRSPIYDGMPIPLDSLFYTTIWALGLIALGTFIFIEMADNIASRS